ncbi:MAG: PQQ-dependent sugar dehydrogenase [Armatimonadetes bacterium]|nr:PQQ-dependent sugar dehydrogenase [Armatimonadota bacterium]
MLTTKRCIQRRTAPDRRRSKRCQALSWAVLAFLAISGSATSQTITLPGYIVETVITGLSLPTTMAFVGDDEILVLEKNSGRVQHYLDGVFQGTAIDLDVSPTSERGLLGICLHPDFANNSLVYLYYSLATSQGGTWLDNRVERFVWNGSTLSFDSTIVVFPSDPAQANGPNHDGGIIRIGPDNKLYVITGDLNRGGFDNPRLEQNTDATAVAGVGGILRLNLDGSIPGDNPFSALDIDARLRALFAYGIRNSFGVAFDPVTGRLWYTENGPNVYDEINIAEPGMNSGWLKIMGPDSRNAIYSRNDFTPFDAADLIYLSGAFYQDPLFSWLQPIGVTAIQFLSGIKFGPAERDRVLVGDNNTGQLFLFEPNAGRDGVVPRTGTADLVADNATERNQYAVGSGWGITTDLQIGPDGYLYVASLTQGAVYRIRRVLDPFVPDSFQIVRGVLTGGELGDLFLSDDQRLDVRAGLTLFLGEPPLQVVVTGTSPVEVPVELRFKLEASVNTPGLTQSIQLFNYDTSSYEQVDLAVPGVSDGIVEVVITMNPGRFVQAGTREMRAKVVYQQVGLTLLWPWSARLDQTVWSIVH